ncbi:MAG: MATE family efflux transporter [Clostridia bacterium]|nr:MATE family efflux transporter [Clostridia bacterium]
MSNTAAKRIGTQKGRDLTTGPIPRQILLFALPLFLSSLVQLMYNTVDVFIAGRFIEGSEAMAAVGASSMIVTLLIMFFNGMSVGANVVAANAFGSKDGTRLRDVVHTAVAVSLIGGLLISVVGFFLSPTILRWTNTPDEIFAEASSYIRIYFLGAVSIVCYNIGVGLHRAMGDSKGPLIYQVIGGVINIVLDVVFVVWLHMGVNGIAVATLFSQTIPAVIVLWSLARRPGPERLTMRHLTIHKDVFFDILRVGIPAAVQAIVITFSNVIVQSQINTFGTQSIAAFTAYFRVENIMYLPMLAYGQTATTFVGQNVGAGRYDRVREGVRSCLIIGLLTSVVTSGLSILFARPLFRLFTTDPVVVELAMEFFYLNAALYFIYNFLEVYSGAIRGSGNAVVPMIIVVFSMCVVRLGFLFLLVGMFHSLLAVAVCYPITWFCASLCLGIYYYAGPLGKRTRNHIREYREKSASVQ